MASEITQLIRRIRRAGLVVEYRGGHYAVLRDGRRIATLAATGGKGRGYRNAVAQIRRAGVYL